MKRSRQAIALILAILLTGTAILTGAPAAAAAAESAKTGETEAPAQTEEEVLPEEPEEDPEEEQEPEGPVRTEVSGEEEEAAEEEEDLLPEEFPEEGPEEAEEGSPEEEAPAEEEVLEEEETMEELDVYEYSVKDFGASGSDSKDDRSAIQKALDKGKSATASKEVTVNVPAGTYYISGPLGIYSNTNLVLASGARIVRTDPSKIMLCNALASKGGYGQLTNVKITGGTWDGNLSDSSGNLKSSLKDPATGHCRYWANLLYFWHGSGLTISNTTLKDCAGTHHLELAGVRDSTVSGVTLKNFFRYYKTRYTATDPNPVGSGSATSVAAEALQLDSCVASHCAGAKPSDGTACKNITVTGCAFQNVMTGVGSHNADHTTRDIRIKNCSFRTIFFTCVQFKNFADSSVTGCTASDITLFLDAWDSAGITVSGSSITYGNSRKLLDKAMFVVGRCTASIKSNTIKGNGLSTLTMAGSGCKVTFSSNKVTLTKAAGASPVYMSSGSLTMNGNTITSLKGVTGGKNTVYCSGGTLNASSNTLNNAESAGFRITGTAAAALKSNKIVSPRDRGYYFSGKSLTASGNVVQDSGGRGIQIGGGTVTISGDTVKNAANHALLVSADGSYQKAKITVSGCDLTGRNSAVTVSNAKASVTVRGSTLHTGTSYPVVHVTAAAGGRVTGCYMSGGNYKKSAAGSSLSISGNVRCAASAGQYSVFFFTGVDAKYLGCQAVTYGKAAKLRSASSLKAKKTGYAFKGWVANRIEDNTWYAVKNGKASWVRMTGGKLPSGYSFYIYKDKAAVAKTAGAGRTVRMCAQWKKK